MQLYAFDILALEGDDLRTLPLHLRKTNLARLLARRPEGIFISEFERGEIGPDLFRQACKFGLEGPAIPWRPLAALDQGEKPKSSGAGKGQGGVFVSDIFTTAQNLTLRTTSMRYEHGPSLEEIAFP